MRDEGKLECLAALPAARMTTPADDNPAFSAAQRSVNLRRNYLGGKNLQKSSLAREISDLQGIWTSHAREKADMYPVRVLSLWVMIYLVGQLPRNHWSEVLCVIHSLRATKIFHLFSANSRNFACQADET
jgi:hypothetical protein